MRKYFFGYLFVKIAKLLAVLALVVGLGYLLWKYGQAHLAAESASYRSSDFLQSQLAMLASVASSTQAIVKGFAGEPALGQMKEPSFASNVSSSTDFEMIKKEIAQLDQDRQQMKQAVISRFEAMVVEIEQKLRARVAALAAISASPATQASAPSGTPESTATPPPVSTEKEMLFVENMGGFEIQRRAALMEKAKQLLILLQTGAENPENRQTLADAATQVDQLGTLLPPVPEPVQPPAPALAEEGPRTIAPSSPPKVFNAEKVANELRAARFGVREAILSSWHLDEVFARTSEAVSIESAKCRLASLSVKGIWLSFFGQAGLAFLAAALVAFLILVFADLTQTLLDTATNTGITAEANKPARATPASEMR